MLALFAATVAAPSASPSQPATAGDATSHSIASFLTPAKAAYGRWHVPLEYVVATRTVLERWTPNDGFTVAMGPRTRPTTSYERADTWRFARSIRRPR